MLSIYIFLLFYVLSSMEYSTTQLFFQNRTTSLTTRPSPPHRQEKNRFIKGGKPVSIGKVPYQASIQFKNRHFCAATIISQDYLLTAAHCFRLISSPEYLSVRTGSAYHSHGGTLYPVKAFLINSNYVTRSHKCDIALLKLKKSLVYSQNVKPIQLAYKKALPATRLGVISGWGKMAFGSSYSESLRWAVVRIFSTVYCKTIYNNLYNSMFCAGNLEGSKGTCNGDSGGPLVVNNRLLGIVSFSKLGCSVQLVPTIYTNAAAFRDWITNITDSESH